MYAMQGTTPSPLSADRAQRLAELLDATSPASRARAGMGGAEVLPVLPDLVPLLPDGGLRAGTVVECADPALFGALAAGPSANSESSWACLIGWRELGLLALSGYGMDLDRLLLVDRPGQQWPEVAVSMFGAVDLVLLGPDLSPHPQLAQRLAARLRQHRCVVLTAGLWPGSHLRFDLESHGWERLGPGHGLLESRRVSVRSAVRGGPLGRPVELLLPDGTGSVAAVDAAAVGRLRFGAPAAAVAAF
jgi:hypothetical protein